MVNERRTVHTRAGIIVLGEDQETVRRLDGTVETESKANREAETW